MRHSIYPIIIYSCYFEKLQKPVGGVAVLPPSGKSGKNKENENVNGQLIEEKSIEFFITTYLPIFAGNDAKDTPVKADSPEKDKKPDKRKVNRHYIVYII